MTRLKWLVVASAATMVACSGTGGTGAITGTVTVAGVKTADVSVDLLGPRTGGAVTDGNGSFTMNGLPDGDFVVRATVPGTREGTKVVAVTVKGGKSSVSPTIAFTTETPVTISGHVVFSDGSDASGVVVTATGSTTQIATTAADGAFSFSGLKPGGFVISVSVGDTREQHLSLGVNATADVDVGNLKFTPSGVVPGIVTYNGAPVAAAQVFVTGTSLTAVTGDQGQFDFTGVPTGSQTLIARFGAEPFIRSATATVTVTRGENQPVSLALSDAPLPTGTVKGHITFEAGAKSPTGITLGVTGLSLTATPNALGDFSFELAIGTHEITATAAHYPVQVVGRVVVTQNDIITMPATTLSVFKPVLTNAANQMYVSEVDNNSSAPATHDMQMVELCDDYINNGEGGWCNSYSLWVLNVATGAMTPVFYGEFDYPTLSPTGDVVAFSTTDAIWAFTIATRTLKSFPLPDDSSWRFNQTQLGGNESYIYDDDGNRYYWSPNGGGVNGGYPLTFSDDGQTLYYARNIYYEWDLDESYGWSTGHRVTRMTLATGEMLSTPGPQARADGSIDFGFANSISYLSHGQWGYVATETDGGASLYQLGGAGFSVVFSGATSTSEYGLSPVPYDWRSLEDGGVEFSILPPGASTPVAVSAVSGAMMLQSFQNAVTPQYPVLQVGTTLDDGGTSSEALLVTAATGATYLLPDGFTGGLPNAAGSTMLLGARTNLDDGGVLVTASLVALPPSGAPTVFAQASADFLTGGWLSNTTVVVAAPPVDADAGVLLTFDTAGTVTTSESAPGLGVNFDSYTGVLLQPTASGWKAYAGDKNFPLGVPNSFSTSVCSAPPWGSSTNLPAFAVFVDDQQHRFLGINSATGVITQHLMSDLDGCIPLGASEVVAVGSSYADGPSDGAFFYLTSGDTVFWRGGAYSNDESLEFVGSTLSHVGFLSTSTDGHSIGFTLLKP